MQNVDSLTKNTLKRHSLQHSVTIISKVSFQRCLAAILDLCEFQVLPKLAFLAT